MVDNVKYDLSVGDTIIETLQNLDLGECLKRPYLIDAIAQLMKTKSGKDGDKYGIGKVINAIHNLTSRDVENILGDPRNVCNIFSILKDRVDSMPSLACSLAVKEEPAFSGFFFQPVFLVLLPI